MRWLVFGALAIASAAGCNAILGIEQKEAKPEVDAALDALIESAAPRANDTCTTDADCVPPNGCYTGRCDTTLGACSYELCAVKGRACAVAACDTAKMTCGDARDYSMRATSYSVTGVTLGCRSADLCVAAAFPYVFLGTGTELVAVLADDLLATSAKLVRVEGVTLHPAQLVASGRRLWILGEPQGTAPPYQLPVAWVDVPSDPTVPSLTGKTVFLAYPFPSVIGFPAPNGGLFVVDNELSKGFPAARLTPPLETGASMAVTNPVDAGAPNPPPTIPLIRVNGPATSTVVGSSGDRLVVYRAPGIVNLVSSAGVAGAAVTPDVPLGPAYTAFTLPRFASSASGAVLMNTAIVSDLPQPDCNCGSHERMHWVVPNAVSPAESAQALDYEAYVGPQIPGQACRVCNPSYMTLAGVIAPVDAHTALGAAPASENRAFTAVRVLGRDPLALPANRRFVTTAADDPQGNFATDRVALASSHGFGYLVLADSQGNKVTLSIIDPGCDAK